VGIADASECRFTQHEISPTLVFTGVATIVLVLAAWPFLKLRLIGDRQRVRSRSGGGGAECVPTTLCVVAQIQTVLSLIQAAACDAVALHIEWSNRRGPKARVERVARRTRSRA